MRSTVNLCCFRNAFVKISIRYLYIQIFVLFYMFSFVFIFFHFFVGVLLSLWGRWFKLLDSNPFKGKNIIVQRYGQFDNNLVPGGGWGRSKSTALQNFLFFCFRQNILVSFNLLTTLILASLLCTMILYKMRKCKKSRLLCKNMEDKWHIVMRG